MAAHSFLLTDLVASVAAVCLFPLFVLVPGLTIGWLTGLFDFRRRTAAFQFAAAVPLSIAWCPVLTYFAGRFASWTAVWVFYGFCWGYALVLFVRRRICSPRAKLPELLLMAAWTVIAIFSLIDLEIGHRAWFPAVAFDYSIRTQFIHSLGAGIPPANPFFLPGHAVPLRYHYFWLLVCAMADLAGGSLVTARHAWIGGTVWCGIGLMASVALYLRLFWYRGPETFRRRALTGMLLLGVTGLDIVPTAGLWVLQAAGMQAILPSMEWWNEQVDGFVYSAIWESHYLAGLIACLTTLLILRDAALQRSAAKRWGYVLLAGLALASAGGTAIYLAFLCGIFLMVWTAILGVQRRWSESLNYAAAGLAAIILFLPFALSLRGPARGGPPLQFWVRPFYPVDALFKGQAIGNAWTIAAANALVLPLNYFCELGFFLLAGVVWWKRRHARQESFSPAELAVALMIGVSMICCTFLRSSVIGNNDLGWRGFLFAQFGLLLWSVDIVSDWRQGDRPERALLTVLLVLGAAGSAYELGINRFYAPLADRGAVPLRSWIAPDRHAGSRTYAQREAGEWTARKTPPDAVVQFNPHVASQDTAALLYSDRRMAAGDEYCLSGFGGDPQLCPAVIETLDRVYPTAGRAADTNLDAVCRSLPIDLIGALDTDPAWQDRHSWVWTQSPVFANGYVRLFRCDSAATTMARSSAAR